MRVLVTGSAGFIGFHTSRRLLEDGHEVIGFDGFTSYYDPKLKNKRQEILEGYEDYISIVGMLEEKELILSTVKDYKPDLVIHLAAQAGVKHSIEHPEAYINSNVVGTFNLLEALRYHRPKHFLIASSSSVYGGNSVLPFEEKDRTASPMSLYAATKSACEAITHSYAHLFHIPTTCMRFFTVYGPWGRPDMALFKFVDRIQRGEEIDVYGEGEMSRDFTYIDDLVEGIIRLTNVLPDVSFSTSRKSANESISLVGPWRVVNIAGGQSVPLSRFIAAIETALGAKAKKKILPIQAGEVVDTFASSELLVSLTNFKPSTSIEQGVEAFVSWYKDYFE